MRHSRIAIPNCGISVPVVAIFLSLCGCQKPNSDVTQPPPAEAFPAATRLVPVDDSVEGLIRQLGDDKYVVREAATRKLTALGHLAIPSFEAKLREPNVEPEVVTRIEMVLDLLDPERGLLSGRFKEHGWAAGGANDHDPNRVTYFRILSVERTSTGLRVSYDWQQGILELQRNGTVLSGTWRQEGSSGMIELNFDADGKFIDGRWNDDKTPDHHWEKAFLR